MLVSNSQALSLSARADCSRSSQTRLRSKNRFAEPPTTQLLGRRWGSRCPAGSLPCLLECGTPRSHSQPASSFYRFPRRGLFFFFFLVPFLFPSLSPEQPAQPALICCGAAEARSGHSRAALPLAADARPPPPSPPGAAPEPPPPGAAPTRYCCCCRRPQVPSRPLYAPCPPPRGSGGYALEWGVTDCSPLSFFFSFFFFLYVYRLI